MTRIVPPLGGVSTMPESTPAGGQITPFDSDNWRLKDWPEPLVPLSRWGADRSFTPGGQSTEFFAAGGFAPGGLAAGGGSGADGDDGLCAGAGTGASASASAHEISREARCIESSR
jgi:hypothetical protein